MRSLAMGIVALGCSVGWAGPLDKLLFHIGPKIEILYFCTEPKDEAAFLALVKSELGKNNVRVGAPETLTNAVTTSENSNFASRKSFKHMTVSYGGVEAYVHANFARAMQSFRVERSDDIAELSEAFIHNRVLDRMASKQQSPTVFAVFEELQLKTAGECDFLVPSRFRQGYIIRPKDE